MRGVKEGNQNVGAFARCNEGRPDVVGNLTFTNNRGRDFERIPVMNVGRCFGDFVRDKDSNVMSGKVASDAVERAIEAVTKSIVEKVAGIDLDAGGIV